MLTIDANKNTFKVSINGTSRLNVLIASIVKRQLLKLLTKPGKTLVLDLNGIYFIDTEGFGTLLSVLKAANNNKCVFKLANVSKEVNELINLMELSETLEIIKNLNNQYYRLNAA